MVIPANLSDCKTIEEQIQWHIEAARIYLDRVEKRPLAVNEVAKAAMAVNDLHKLIHENRSYLLKKLK